MATAAIVGGFSFKRQAASGSPITYVTVPEVVSISGLGAQNELVDATSFDSAGSREYVGGLADGQEVSIECIYVPNSVQQEAFIAAVAAKATSNFKVTVTSSSPNVNFAFAAANIGWSVAPSVDGVDHITFTIKISGAITVS